MEKERLIQLVTSLQNNEEDSAAQIYEAFHDDIYYFILKTVNDPDLAADLTQDTFIEIFEKIQDLREPAAFITWSKQIAYHRCTAYFRKRRELLADENEDGVSVFDTQIEDHAEFIPDESLDIEEFKKSIHIMIDSLPKEQRSAILLRYFQELSVKEIAQIQGVTEGTVKSRLNYARKNLMKAISKYEKKNHIKLHCVGVVPLLLYFFRAYRIANGLSLTQPVGAVIVSAFPTAAATTTTAVITTKVAAVVVAVAVATGGTVAAVHSDDPSGTESPNTQIVMDSNIQDSEALEDSEEYDTSWIETEESEMAETELLDTQDVPSGSLNIGIGYNGAYYVADIGSYTGTDILIPSEYNGNSVTIIGDRAFYNSDITSVTLPGSITHIGVEAFSFSQALSSVTFQEGITTIDRDAFYLCTSLSEVNFPDSLISINQGSFTNCSSLENVFIPRNVSYISPSAFRGCSALSSLTIDAANPTYHSAENCIIETGSMTLVTAPSATTIPADENITIIAAEAFKANPNLVNAILPSGVTRIETEAFSLCSSLTSVIIPASVTFIGADAFAQDSNITDIYYSGTKEEWNHLTSLSSFLPEVATITIHCSDGEIVQN